MSHIEAVRTGYDHDFVAWTAEQACLLRGRQLAGVDVRHLAEEIEDLGRNTRRQLESRLEILVAHLLKWQCQPQCRGSSWQRTILIQRRDIARLMLRNPSLGARRAEYLRESYDHAVRLAEADTALPRGSFPPICVWAIEQVLDDAFWPEPYAPAE